MNVVIVSGIVVTPIQIDYPNGNMARVRFILRAEYRDQTGVYYDNVNIVVWGGYAETIANQVNQGQKITVHGRLKTTSYQKNNESRVHTEVVVHQIEL